MPVYVQHEVLGKVNDVFNAESIWQAPGLALFSRRPLLRDLLERSPREHRGRAPTRCFSHITLMLAQEELDDDRHLTRGARLRDLTASLKALHQRDFGDLLGNDEVRYDVRGTEQLEPGEVEVKFGHAVYLPVPGEAILYQVTASDDGASWQRVCPIYLHQRLSLIGQDPELATHQVPNWPFAAEGAILLVNDGPDTPVEVQVRPKNAYQCQHDAERNAYVISARPGFDAGGDPLQLLVRIERVLRPAATQPVPRTPAPAAVWKTRSESDLTAVPFGHRPASFSPADATCAPCAQQRITLAGLALPRLSRYRETGATSIEIGLDSMLRLASEGADSPIRFVVDAQDTMHAVTASGKQAVSAPFSFTPGAGGKVELLPVTGPMSERYCATLALRQGPSIPVSASARLVFGRGSPALAALRVLDSPRFLQRGDGPDTASADRLGLSRNAFSFEAGPAGYLIGRLSATQALFHLDDKLAFIASVETATPEQPYLLPHGHHLVAGHYILRFDA